MYSGYSAVILTSTNGQLKRHVENSWFSFSWNEKRTILQNNRITVHLFMYQTFEQHMTPVGSTYFKEAYKFLLKWYSLKNNIFFPKLMMCSTILYTYPTPFETRSKNVSQELLDKDIQKDRRTKRISLISLSPLANNRYVVMNHELYTSGSRPLKQLGPMCLFTLTDSNKKWKYRRLYQSNVLCPISHCEWYFVLFPRYLVMATIHRASRVLLLFCNLTGASRVYHQIKPEAIIFTDYCPNIEQQWENS